MVSPFLYYFLFIIVGQERLLAQEKQTFARHHKNLCFGSLLLLILTFQNSVFMQKLNLKRIF